VRCTSFQLGMTKHSLDKTHGRLLLGCAPTRRW
jgi:hypothetical protein